MSTMFDLAFGEAGDPPPLRVAYWHEMASPIGRLFLAAGENGRVRRVTFAGNANRFIDDLLDAGWVPLRDRARVEPLEEQLDEYFGGRRTSFDLEADLSMLKPFHRAVLEATAAIRHGGWETYGGLAIAIGRPRAARAVGNALGANPVPLLVPCHRILAAGGRIGGYGGGLEIKRHLLALEGLRVT